MPGERVGDERRRVRAADRRQSAVHAQLHRAVLDLLSDAARRAAAGHQVRQHSHGVSVREGVVARSLGRLLQTAHPRTRRRPAGVRLVLAEGLLLVENRSQYVIYVVTSSVLFSNL